MTQNSDAVKKTHIYQLATGGEVVVTMTFYNVLDSEPFMTASESPQIILQLLIEVDVSGDILEEQKIELANWIANHCPPPAPSFLKY